MEYRLANFLVRFSFFKKISFDIHLWYDRSKYTYSLVFDSENGHGFVLNK